MVSPQQRALAEQVGRQQELDRVLSNGSVTGRRPEAVEGGGSGVIGLSVQDEGSATGAINSVRTLNFTGAGVSASQTGDTVTVAVSGGGGGGSGNSYMPGGW